MARRPVTRKQKTEPPESTPMPESSTDPEADIRAYLRDGANHLVAEYPCDEARKDPGKWARFENALRARHLAKHPVDSLLRQRSKDGRVYRYWRE